jgi:site-specific recombinase XerD
MPNEGDEFTDFELASDGGGNGLGKENLPALVGEMTVVPTFITAGGERAGFAFIDFFTAQIRNRNTRAAYAVAVRSFCAWCDAKGLTLGTLRTHHVAAYIEFLGRAYSPPSVKQHLAAIRMLFDWMVVRQVVEINPAAAVRGPKHVVKRGKTPVLEADEARKLLDSINTSTPVGLRDRAFIALLVYTFSRVSAAIGMNVRDYYPQGKRWWVRLHEKGGKRHEMPAHHLLETYMDEYLEAAGITEDKGSPLFRTAAGKTGQLTDRRMTRTDALRMIWRRAAAAGIKTELGCHSFRATGITVYLQNGGLLEHAQQMAAHESTRTTKLYDRRSDKITLDEVEKILL